MIIIVVSQYTIIYFLIIIYYLNSLYTLLMICNILSYYCNLFNSCLYNRNPEYRMLIKNDKKILIIKNKRRFKKDHKLKLNLVLDEIHKNNHKKKLKLVLEEIHRNNHKKKLKLVLRDINLHKNSKLWKYSFFKIGFENIKTIILNWNRICKKETSKKIFWWDLKFIHELFKFCQENNIKVFIISELKPELIKNIIKEIYPNFINLTNIYTPYNYYKTILSPPKILPITRISKNPCKVEINQILDDLIQINDLNIKYVIYFGDQNRIIKNTFNIPALNFDLWKGIYLSINEIINK